MSIINIITIIVSAALTAAFLELLKFLFFKKSSFFWKGKTEGKKPVKKKKSSPFFDVADFTSKKKNPYEEK